MVYMSVITYSHNNTQKRWNGGRSTID